MVGHLGQIFVRLRAIFALTPAIFVVSIFLWNSSVSSEGPKFALKGSTKGIYWIDVRPQIVSTCFNS